MNEISVPRFTSEDLAAHITSALARHTESSEQVEHAKAALTEPLDFGVDTVRFVARESPRIELQPAFQPADDPTGYQAADLLRYHDKDFLRNAYRAVLKRLPDADGFNDYLQRLRSGRISKIDVLASMRYSAEGAAHAVRIKSLRFPALVRRAGRVPVAGYFVRLAIAILRLPRNTEMQRQAEAHATAQTERVAEHLNEVARHTTSELQRLADHFQRALDASRTEHARAIAEQHAHLNALVAATEQHASDLRDALALHDKRLAAHEHDIAEQEQNLARADSRADEMRTRLGVIHGVIHEALQNEVHTISQNLQHTRMELTLERQRLSRFLHAATSSPSTHTNELATAPLDNSSPMNDAFYAAFMERFRGSIEAVTSRLRTHLPLPTDLPEGEIVDLGSGRGEWLSLLRDAGQAAYGVDTNQMLAEDCRARGLRVVEAEALAHLTVLPDESLAGVSGFHIVEHLAPDDLLRLLAEVMRVLRPGGLLLLETPNAQNVLVGSHLFYTDLTHRHPLPSSTLQFLLETCGFDSIVVREHHPRDADKLAPDDELTRRFNDLFYGAMDYSISGRKPMTATQPAP